MGQMAAVQPLRFFCQCSRLALRNGIHLAERDDYSALPSMRPVRYICVGTATYEVAAIFAFALSRKRPELLPLDSDL